VKVAAKVAKAKQENFEFRLEEQAIDVGDLMIQESAVVSKLQLHKTQEQAEQAAVIRNINEFSQILSMCNLESDRNAHRVVSDTMVQLGSTKWRESRARVAPVHKTLDKLRMDRQGIEKKKHDLVLLHQNLSKDMGQMAMTLTKARFKLGTFTSKMEQIQTQAKLKEEEAYRVGFCVKQLKAVLTQLESAYKVFWGGSLVNQEQQAHGAHAQQRFDNAD